MMMSSFGVVSAVPAPQPRNVSLLTKGATLTMLGGAIVLYAAFSRVYKQECLAHDEVMESSDFKEFSFKIIKGILSFDPEVRIKYMDKYLKIATVLQVTVASFGLSVLLGFNDLVNYLA